MTELLIITQSDYDYDPRVQKEVKTATENNILVTVYCYGVGEREINERTNNGTLICKVPYIFSSLRSKIKQKFVKRIPTGGNIPVSTARENIMYKMIRLVFDSFFMYIGSQIHLYVKINNTHFKIIQATDLNTLLTGVIYKFTHGAKLVYDTHELWTEMFDYNPTWMNKLTRAYEKFLIKHADEVITVNQSIAEELVKRYNIKPPYVVLNCPEYQPVSNMYNPGNFNVIYQGRYTKDRGLEEFILASKFLPPNIRVFLRGFDGYGGGYEEDLIAFADKNEANVTFLNPVTMTEMVTSLSGFNIGVVPYKPVSLNNYYATPNKIFEYLMAGMPVVVSDLPELRKVAIGHGTGCTFDPDSPRGMADAIICATNNYKQYSHNAYCVSRKIYNWEEQSKILISAYNKLKVI